ncbi:MAG TPA: copper resistance CopC family protein [Gemmatimonadales bacterium]|jgi:methionine-rich copper-binding protein CopC
MHRPKFVLGAIASLAIALPAAAMHTHLVKAEPGVDSTVATAPKQVRLWFNEVPEVALSAASIMKEDHSPVAVVKMAATDDSLSVAGPVPISLEPGRYMVMWRTGSADGHAVRGMYFFTYDPTVRPKP